MAFRLPRQAGEAKLAAGRQPDLPFFITVAHQRASLPWTSRISLVPSRSRSRNQASQVMAGWVRQGGTAALSCDQSCANSWPGRRAPLVRTVILAPITLGGGASVPGGAESATAAPRATSGLGLCIMAASATWPKRTPSPRR